MSTTTLPDTGLDYSHQRCETAHPLKVSVDAHPYEVTIMYGGEQVFLADEEPDELSGERTISIKGIQFEIGPDGITMPNEALPGLFFRVLNEDAYDAVILDDSFWSHHGRTHARQVLVEKDPLCLATSISIGIETWPPSNLAKVFPDGQFIVDFSSSVELRRVVQEAMGTKIEGVSLYSWVKHILEVSEPSNCDVASVIERFVASVSRAIPLDDEIELPKRSTQQIRYYRELQGRYQREYLARVAVASLVHMQIIELPHHYEIFGTPVQVSLSDVQCRYHHHMERMLDYSLYTVKIGPITLWLDVHKRLSFVETSSSLDGRAHSQNETEGDEVSTTFGPGRRRIRGVAHEMRRENPFGSNTVVGEVVVAHPRKNDPRIDLLLRDTNTHIWIDTSGPQGQLRIHMHSLDAESFVGQYELPLIFAEG